MTRSQTPQGTWENTHGPGDCEGCGAENVDVAPEWIPEMQRVQPTHSAHAEPEWETEVDVQLLCADCHSQG